MIYDHWNKMIILDVQFYIVVHLLVSILIIPFNYEIFKIKKFTIYRLYKVKS